VCGFYSNLDVWLPGSREVGLAGGKDVGCLAGNTHAVSGMSEMVPGFSDK